MAGLCYDCGTTANNMTCLRKYGARAKKECFEVSTVADGVCDCCGQEKPVAPIRDFFYPDEQAIQIIQKYLMKGDI